jgi:hypothetical protein
VRNPRTNGHHTLEIRELSKTSSWWGPYYCVIYFKKIIFILVPENDLKLGQEFL